MIVLIFRPMEGFRRLLAGTPRPAPSSSDFGAIRESLIRFRIALTSTPDPASRYLLRGFEAEDSAILALLCRRLGQLINQAAALEACAIKIERVQISGDLGEWARVMMHLICEIDMTKSHDYETHLRLLMLERLKNAEQDLTENAVVSEGSERTITIAAMSERKQTQIQEITNSVLSDSSLADGTTASINWLSVLQQER